MSERTKIHDFLKVTSALTRAQFLEKYNHPVLLQLLTPDGDPMAVAEQKKMIRRKARRLTQDLIKTPIETGAFVLADRSPITGHFYFIMNAGSTTKRSFIGVGTDPTSDITLTNPAISQRHGFFKYVNGMTFSDAGSKNGTLLNKQKLATRKPEKLINQDALLFGNVSAFSFLTANGFYEFLRACSLAPSI
jgi:pSer/pThr/pTyr-binding forkhead associated (FHA) protein